MGWGRIYRGTWMGCFMDSLRCIVFVCTIYEMVMNSGTDLRLEVYPRVYYTHIT